MNIDKMAAHLQLPPDLRRPILWLADPGIAHLGHALVAVDDIEKGTVTLESQAGEDLHAGVLTTDPEHKARGGKKVEDHGRRIMEITGIIEPRIAAADIVVIEAISLGMKNTQTMVLMCLVYGAIFSLCRVHRVPCVQIAPVSMKKAVVGRRDASKAEIEAAVRAIVPGAAAAIDAVTATSIREHVADAIGFGVAAPHEMTVQAVLASFRRRHEQTFEHKNRRGHARRPHQD